MPYYGQARSTSASEASPSSSLAFEEDHNNSTATSSTSPHALELRDESDDPSFDSQRVVTSTPRKMRSTRSRHEETEEELDQDDLRLSDTESLELLDDYAIERGMERFEEEQHQARLTRRSLATHLQGGDSLQSPHHSHSLTPRGISVPQTKFMRAGDLYAPSPSTGSSTLVEREEDAFRKPRERGSTMRKGRHGSARAVPEEDVVYENDEEEDQRTETQSFSRDNRATVEDDEGSSSSPRPARRRTVNDLATYIDARLSSSAPPSSTPRRSPKSRRQLNSTLPPQTPHAPGAFPSSARKPRSSSPPAIPSSETPVRSSTSTRQKTPPSNGSSSAQIHDAFARFITGPKGALTNSAERRAAMQSHATQTPASVSKREREKVETPDFAGRYSFVPSSTLPVEKQRRVTDQGESETEDVRPTNSEHVLRRVGGKEDQRESDFAQRRRPEYEERPVEGSEEEDRREEIPTSEEDEVRVAQRSAIDFAMARSFVDRPEEEASAEDSSPDDRPIPARRSSELRSSVRFVEPSPRSRSRSPSPPPTPPPQPLSASSRQPSRSDLTSARAASVQRRPARSASPELPPLPPLLAPDSPEPVRNLPPQASFRRSNSDDRRESSLRDPVSSDSPSTPRRPPNFDSLPPRSPLLPSSPPPLEPPKSSTPPRRTVQPPNPDATPPRASPSPLARRTKPSPMRPGPPPILSPPFVSSSTEGLLESPPIDDQEQDVSIPLLVNQLSEAVRALTAAHASPRSPARRANILKKDPGDSHERLAKELARRKEESERKRRELEEELLQLETRDQAQVGERGAVVTKLAEAYEVEHELGYKVEDLRKSIQEMGQLVGVQVAQAVNDTLQHETRKRAHWLALAFCFQLGLFWVLLRLANANSSFLLDSSYLDPFQPHEFHLPFNPYATDAALSPDTIALFTPYVSSHSSWHGIEATASILKGSIERLGRLAAKWTESRAILTSSGRLAVSSSKVVPI